MQAALASLQNARSELELARTDKGGHRVRAIESLTALSRKPAPASNTPDRLRADSERSIEPLMRGGKGPIFVRT